MPPTILMVFDRTTGIFIGDSITKKPMNTDIIPGFINPFVIPFKFLASVNSIIPYVHAKILKNMLNIAA
ncbi:hypothetical protein CPJCM30710_21060 [Clostridium polyendosporum]|uniref:Uncharacterized protein n=1 Tax=Clostridium polyendosporum TaxID=69208 RepID=A0A919S1H0_9CLOT|nr:hypothetical protein CPJCM30710_21060 [Clostridium polyendosporum]